MGAERNGADSILPDGFLWLAEARNASIRFGNEEDRKINLKGVKRFVRTENHDLLQKEK